MSSPGREEGRTFHYQPASRRSLAQVDYIFDDDDDDDDNDSDGNDSDDDELSTTSLQAEEALQCTCFFYTYGGILAKPQLQNHFKMGGPLPSFFR